MGKILNVSLWIHLRFFPMAKIEYQLNLHFLATGRFCRPSLVTKAQRLLKVITEPTRGWDASRVVKKGSVVSILRVLTKRGGDDEKTAGVSAEIR
jgi:hypothetical protein